MKDTQAKWDAIYRLSNLQTQPCQVLADQQFLLPKQGKALDLACGLGSNALLLAKAGLQVEAWDISPVALTYLQKQADIHRLQISTKQRNITPEMLPVAEYDVIVISRFLDRSLCNAIMMALKSDGLLFYQTFTRAKLDPQGPGNPDFLLDTNELLRLFRPLTLIHYQEHAKIGNLQYGNRNEAQFIGQKLLLESL